MPCLGRAQEGSVEIIRDIPAANLERVLSALNLEYQEVKPGIYRFTLGKYKVLLFNKGSDLQFFASFKKPKTTFGRINDWNRTDLGRFSRAYLDKDGDPCIESDLDVSGGITKGALAAFFKKWIENLAKFTEYIDFR